MIDILDMVFESMKMKCASKLVRVRYIVKTTVTELRAQRNIKRVPTPWDTTMDWGTEAPWFACMYVLNLNISNFVNKTILFSIQETDHRPRNVKKGDCTIEFLATCKEGAADFKRRNKRSERTGVRVSG